MYVTKSKGGWLRHTFMWCRFMHNGMFINAIPCHLIFSQLLLLVQRPNPHCHHNLLLLHSWPSSRGRCWGPIYFWTWCSWCPYSHFLHLNMTTPPKKPSQTHKFTQLHNLKMRIPHDSTIFLLFVKCFMPVSYNV